MKRIIQSADAPAPIGPYNQATMVGGMLFISGQIAINPVTGELVTDTIESETEQVLNNLKAIVEKAGYQMKDIVKCSVFVKNMQHFSRINAVYARYFDDETAPARELVEVSALPRYVNIEISAIAAK
jgi:2-iminobutanoate/2-iminopropanoate deaminase